jgi:hypothetical protein
MIAIINFFKTRRRIEAENLQYHHKVFWNVLIQKIKRREFAETGKIFKCQTFTELYQSASNFPVAVVVNSCFGCYKRGRSWCYKGCLFDVSNLYYEGCLNGMYNDFLQLFDKFKRKKKGYAKLIFTMKKIRDWPLNKKWR